jgi:hypothetical protein
MDDFKRNIWQLTQAKARRSVPNSKSSLLTLERHDNPKKGGEILGDRPRIR